MDLDRLVGKKPNLRCRADITLLIRQFFRKTGCLEIDTPQLSAYPLPEAFINLISTERGWLLPSPEVYMKPLLAAGFGDIFQICRAFRKEESGTQHLEEFTMLEYYRVGKNYLELVDETEKLICHIASSLHDSLILNYQGERIDLSSPWMRLTVSEAFSELCGWDPLNTSDPERFDLELATRIADISRKRPLVIYDFPAKMASLSRLKKDDNRAAERAEIFIGGLELANIFSELTDQAEQRCRFTQEIQTAGSNERKIEMPEDFLSILNKLPETAGGALGIDRLVMLFCDTANIRDVNAF